MNAMTKPDISPPRVYGAIVQVMAALSKEGISKGRKNQQQGYNFRGIDDVLNALSSELSAARLLMLPTVLERTCDERQTKSGGALFYTTVRVRFDLISADDGSTHSIVTIGEAMDSADKSTNKAMSAAMKYASLLAFCIPVEGTDDADNTTHEVAAKTAAAAAQQPAKPAPTNAERAQAAVTALANVDTRDKFAAISKRAQPLIDDLRQSAPKLAEMVTKAVAAADQRLGAPADDFPGDPADLVHDINRKAANLGA